LASRLAARPATLFGQRFSFIVSQLCHACLSSAFRDLGEMLGKCNRWFLLRQHFQNRPGRNDAAGRWLSSHCLSSFTVLVMEISEGLLTPDDVAKWLRVPRKWVIEHTNRYEPIIPHIRMGRAVRFRREDIEAFLNERVKKTPKWQ
jgi:excisionase family DNA binding protein